MGFSIRKYGKYLIYFLGIICIVGILFFNYFLYPIKYKNEIIENSTKYGVDRALIASIIVSESSFNKDAKSPKGALGLMQLLPSTAKWLCEKSDIIYDKTKLFEAEYNIKLGTIYIKYLIDKFKDKNVAIVAYNAGEGIVANWLKNTEYSLNGKTLIKIPYKETANYLTKVNRAINIYKDRL